EPGGTPHGDGAPGALRAPQVKEGRNKPCSDERERERTAEREKPVRLRRNNAQPPGCFDSVKRNEKTLPGANQRGEEDHREGGTHRAAGCDPEPAAWRFGLMLLKHHRAQRPARLAP